MVREQPEHTAHASITWRALHPGFGAELVVPANADLMDLAAHLVELVRRRRVVLVRRPRLSVRSHLRLAASMGTVVAVTGSGPWSRRPAVRIERRPGSHTDRWHADQSWSERPDVLSVLACLRADPAADPTQFADTTIALGLVDPELRSDLDGLDAYHHVELSRRHRASPDHASRATSVSRRAIARLVGHLHQALTPAWATFYSPTPVAAMGARHRIVDEDPLTGRHFVRLGDHAWRTTHRDDVRSAQIIDELNTILVGADNVITHRWQAGDLVVYDNRMILHRRLVEGAARASRTLRRVLVIPPEAN